MKNAVKGILGLLGCCSLAFVVTPAVFAESVGSGTESTASPNFSPDKEQDLSIIQSEFIDKELQKDTKSISLRGDDERLRPDAQFQTTIGEALLTFTGGASMDFNGQKDIDLDSSRPGDRLRATPELSLDFIVSFPNQWYVFSEIGAFDEVAIRDGRKPMNAFFLQLNELFLDAPLPLTIPSGIRVGRQQFFEPRRWIFDKSLDGLRFFFDPHPFHFNLSIGSPLAPTPDNESMIFNDIFQTRHRLNFLLDSTYALTPASTLGAYVLYRYDNSVIDESPVWVGIRAYGREKYKFSTADYLKAKIKYWFDAAFVGGTVQSKTIRGFGLDLGGSYIFYKYPFQPYATVGYAFGTGDSHPTDRVDHGFRQSGLQGNTGKYGGVVNFDYYGILVDPELSNLHIVTAGIGARPLPNTSIDLIYHRYQQHTASSQIRAYDLSPRPTGGSTHLGDELDVILGYRAIQNIRIRWRNGFFFPGAAFVQDDYAFESRLDILFTF